MRAEVVHGEDVVAIFPTSEEAAACIQRVKAEALEAAIGGGNLVYRWPYALITVNPLYERDGSNTIGIYVRP